MSDVPGIAYLSVDCWCTPPKRLTTNAEKHSDRCDDCGVEILTGEISTKPRMYLVQDEQESADA